jgi:hypothetical protein
MLKSILLTFALAVAALAQVPYSRTQGPITVYVTDWSTDAARLTGAPGAGSRQHVYGVWITACTVDGSTVPSKAVLVSRAGGQVVTRTDDFPPLDPAKCSSVVAVNVKRADVVNLVIVTSAFSFTDIGQ